MIDITINRMGTFSIDDDQVHPNQCGKVGVKNYKYKVSCTGDSEHLDEHGFLIDNMVIYDYFKIRYEHGNAKCESCEVMALHAIAFLQAHCRANNIEGIKKIYVEIWGSDHSYIVAEWFLA